MSDSPEPTPRTSRVSVVVRWVIPVVAGLAIGALVLVLVPFFRGGGAASDPGAESTVTSSPTSTPTPTAAPTVEPTTEPTAEASETPAPTASGDYLTTAGYGEVKLGKPVPTDTDLVEWVQATGDCGYWALSVGSGMLYSKGKTAEVTGIELWEGSAPTTKSGAHIGMSRSELEKLFPNAAHPDDRLYIVKDNLGQVVFDVESSTDEVSYIRVLETSNKVHATGGHGICD